MELLGYLLSPSFLRKSVPKEMVQVECRPSVATLRPVRDSDVVRHKVTFRVGDG